MMEGCDLRSHLDHLSIVFRYLPKVFDRYSSADGFMFLHDDTILNYWNLLQADKSKLWITNKVNI